MVLLNLALLGMIALWCILAGYWLAPDLFQTIMQSYDLSDIILSGVIVIMAISMFGQEKRQQRSY